jgi:hypothetical protein
MPFSAVRLAPVDSAPPTLLTADLSSEEALRLLAPPAASVLAEDSVLPAPLAASAQMPAQPLRVEAFLVAPNPRALALRLRALADSAPAVASDLPLPQQPPAQALVARVLPSRELCLTAKVLAAPRSVPGMRRIPALPTPRTTIKASVLCNPTINGLSRSCV